MDVDVRLGFEGVETYRSGIEQLNALFSQAVRAKSGHFHTTPAFLIVEGKTQGAL